MKKHTKCLLGAGALLLASAALDTRLKTVSYVLYSPKVSESIRLAVLSDLHSCHYGTGQIDLLHALHRTAPDAVLLPGDFYDDILPPDNARILAQAAAAAYPTYYAAGNHEIASGDSDTIKDELRSFGVTVLEGTTALLNIRTETILLAGLDDPFVGDDRFGAQADALRAALDKEERYSVLLSHRPEKLDLYASLHPDLVVCGHAHGGQWRIPFLLNGVYAPHQGIFPSLAGGLYKRGDTTMIVSRGLARETVSIPRIFNRPELVLIEIQPCR